MRGPVHHIRAAWAGERGRHLETHIHPTSAAARAGGGAARRRLVPVPSPEGPGTEAAARALTLRTRPQRRCASWGAAGERAAMRAWGPTPRAGDKKIARIAISLGGNTPDGRLYARRARSGAQINRASREALRSLCAAGPFSCGLLNGHECNRFVWDTVGCWLVVVLATRRGLLPNAPSAAAQCFPRPDS